MFFQQYKGLYKHLLSKLFENGALGQREMLQYKCLFLPPTRNMFPEKFVKWVKLVVVLREYIISNVE